jgi:hypothetical protein
MVTFLKGHRSQSSQGNQSLANNGNGHCHILPTPGDTVSVETLPNWLPTPGESPLIVQAQPAYEVMAREPLDLLRSGHNMEGSFCTCIPVSHRTKGDVMQMTPRQLRTTNRKTELSRRLLFAGASEVGHFIDFQRCRSGCRVPKLWAPC